MTDPTSKVVETGHSAGILEMKNFPSKLRILVKIPISLKLKLSLQNSNFFVKTEIFLSETQKILPKYQLYIIAEHHGYREMIEQTRLV